MAHITPRKNKNGTTSWRASVRLTGYPQMQRSFETESQAREWAEITEKGMKNPYLLRPTFNMVVNRYIKEILPTKSPDTQYDQERHFTFWKNHFGSMFLDEITPYNIENTANILYQKINKVTKKTCGPETRRKYLMSLSYLFNIAAKEWNWIKYNPVSSVKKHKPPKMRVDNKKELNESCPIRQLFLDEVKQEMSKRNLTQGGLAHLMGVNKSTVQALFDPTVNITVRMLLRVCKVLNKRMEITFHDEA